MKQKQQNKDTDKAKTTEYRYIDQTTEKETDKARQPNTDTDQSRQRNKDTDQAKKKQNMDTDQARQPNTDTD